MVDKKQLEEVYKQNLENDIINAISEMKRIDSVSYTHLDVYKRQHLQERQGSGSGHFRIRLHGT